MKKITSWVFTLIAIITTSITFTSCNDDVMQAIDLKGEWRGKFGMYYEDRNGNQWDAEYSIIEFYQNNGFSSRGYGKQYDYYRLGPIEWEYYQFNWEIKNGVIYIDYPYDTELNTSIYDYRMSSTYFTGYFGDTNSSFRLDKWKDWRWDGYNGYYDYYYRSGYYYDYYSKTRSTESKTKTEPHEMDNIIVRHGNRNNKLE